MSHETVSAQEQPPNGLSIGALARLTQVEPDTLRAWERRHGFPAAHRTGSGHRRYAPESVAQVQEVQRRRAGGIGLDQAIKETLADVSPGSDSVFAELRRRHPDLRPVRLRKQTLLALTWAIEDETVAGAGRGDLFGLFQREANFHRARQRWQDMARSSVSTWVFAERDPALTSRDGDLTFVPITAGSPLRREWAVICDSPQVTVGLSAWELPGQSAVRDRDRLFEAVWTTDPRIVRHASRVCAQVAASEGIPGSAELVERMGRPVTTAARSERSLHDLWTRVIVYLDAAYA